MPNPQYSAGGVVEGRQMSIASGVMTGTTELTLLSPASGNFIRVWAFFASGNATGANVFSWKEDSVVLFNHYVFSTAAIATFLANGINYVDLAVDADLRMDQGQNQTVQVTVFYEEITP